MNTNTSSADFLQKLANTEFLDAQRRIIRDAVLAIGFWFLTASFAYLHFKAPEAIMLKEFGIGLGIVAILWSATVGFGYRKYKRDKQAFVVE